MSSKGYWHLGKVIESPGFLTANPSIAHASAQSQHSARERASAGRFPRRNEVVDISSLPQWHGARILSVDNVVVIYTGLRRWWCPLAHTCLLPIRAPTKL
jgi:hypothetical protein